MTRNTEEENLAVVRRYVELVPRGPSPELEALYDEAVIQDEYPNRLLPNGARRDLAALREAGERGRALLASQAFEIVHMYASGQTVIVESIWTGTVGAAVGPFQPGMTMRARFAQFFELRNGKIAAIRNYDCFDPF